jgi:exonuclease III
MDMRFATWNVRSLYWADSMVTALKELSIYKLHLVRVQEVRLVDSGSEPAGEYTFFYGKGNENHELGTGFSVHKRIISVGTGFSVHKRIISAVQRVEFVSDRMSSGA